MIPNHHTQLVGSDEWTNAIPGPGRMVVSVSCRDAEPDTLGGTAFTIQRRVAGNEWQDVAVLSSAGMRGYPCEDGHEFRAGIKPGEFGTYPIIVQIACEPEIYFGGNP